MPFLITTLHFERKCQFVEVPEPKFYGLMFNKRYLNLVDRFINKYPGYKSPSPILSKPILN